MEDGSPHHFLLPAAVFAERKPFVIDTILGSCIAVCLYDYQLKFGGMNHYILPFWNGDGLASPKYGNIAIERLVEKMISQGSVRKNLIAKFFGGATQFNSTFSIGDWNIQLARKQLALAGIHIAAEHVGGCAGRRISFDTYTGQVKMKILQTAVNNG